MKRLLKTIPESFSNPREILRISVVSLVSLLLRDIPYSIFHTPYSIFQTFHILHLVPVWARHSGVLSVKISETNIINQQTGIYGKIHSLHCPEMPRISKTIQIRFINENISRNQKYFPFHLSLQTQQFHFISVHFASFKKPLLAHFEIIQLT